MSASATHITEQDILKLTEQQRAQIALLERMLFETVKQKDQLFVYLLFALRSLGVLTILRADLDSLLLDQYRIDIQDEPTADHLRVRLLHINDPLTN